VVSFCFPNGNINKRRFRSKRTSNSQKGELVAQGHFASIKPWGMMMSGSLTRKFVLSYQFNHTISAATPGAFQDTVTLNGVTDYAFLGNGYDSFRIDWAEMRIVPSFNTTTSTDPEYNIFATCVNLENSTATSLSKICTSSNAIVTTLGEEHYHRWRPYWQISNIIGRGWVPLTAPGTAWYGVKSYIGIAENNNGVMTYFVRFGVTFRGNRA